MSMTILITAGICSCCKNESAEDLSSYANPLYGTLSSFRFSTGNTYPATAVPWGMHFWTPQTAQSLNDGWAYSYYKDDLRIYGIRQTHQPSPWMGDYGQFNLMPCTNANYADPQQRSSAFSHKSEVSKPYYYSVYLADHDCFVELAPTEHAAAIRICYPEREMSYLYIDTDSPVRVEGNRIYGTSSKHWQGLNENFANYFVIEADTDIDLVDGAAVGFKTPDGKTINLKVASSFISHDQALLNMNEVNAGLEAVKEEGHRKWNDVLGRIKVKDDNIDNKRIFYTCLYRSLLFPRSLSEIDAEGKRVHYSPYDGQVHEGHLYSDTGFWDTFRSLFALIDWIYPETAQAIQEGLVNHYLESGFLPEWGSPGHRSCMIGNNSASVVAEAYLKGLRGYDIEKLWEAVVHDANNVEPTSRTSGRVAHEQYYSLGYVPCDIGVKESAARTLEYAYDDWCIWQLGKALGKSEEELSQYEKASQNYRNIYRSECSMACGRNSDGSWRGELNPYKWGGDFTEGNSIQYTWSVFHDPKGLMELMGGRENYEKNLDAIFDLPPFYDDSAYGFMIHEILEMLVMNYGNYAHGNQPAQHIAYMYDYCGKPEKTQYRVREIMRRFYTPGPDCYCGDEDNGQTSAWYVFSALGFYPVCPASCEYALGSPLFKEAVVSVPGHKSLKIKAKDNSEENVYAKDIRLGCRKIKNSVITHDQLLGGGTLNFEMTK